MRLSLTLRALLHGCSITLVVLLTDMAHGQKASTYLSSMISSSDAIVRGRVVSIKRVGQVRLAEVNVKNALKGLSDQPRLTFVASRLGNHDSSDAKWGEELFLFLRRCEFGEHPSGELQSLRGLKSFMAGRPLYIIESLGSGRIPISVVNKQHYVCGKRVNVIRGVSVYSTEGLVILPSGIEPAKDVFIRYLYAIKADDIERAITEAVSKWNVKPVQTPASPNKD